MRFKKWRESNNTQRKEIDTSLKVVNRSSKNLRLEIKTFVGNSNKTTVQLLYDVGLFVFFFGLFV